MANLREQGLASSDAIGRNRRRVEIFLEGKDDVAIFGMYWFHHLSDKVEFRRAEEGPKSTPGCNGVRESVRQLRTSGGIPAFGILDRDSVPDSYEACETDDITFLSRNESRDPYLYYTLFWEIENYLIDAQGMEEERCDSSSSPEPCRTPEEVHRELREHCETLTPHAALNAHLHLRGKKKVGDGHTNNHSSRAEVDDFIRNSSLAGAPSGDIADYEAWLTRIDAFDDPTRSDQERVRLMNRRIHGKAILQRFFNRRNIGDEMRFRLARRLSASPPPELLAKLSEWVQA